MAWPIECELIVAWFDPRIEIHNRHTQTLLREERFADACELILQTNSIGTIRL